MIPMLALFVSQEIMVYSQKAGPTEKNEVHESEAEVVIKSHRLPPPHSPIG
jgi:hypothetical protein